QIESDRARARALPDQHVEMEVLHRGIEDLLDGRRQPVDLVDEEHVAGFEVREQRGEIARAFEYRTAGRAQRRAHLACEHVGERRLAEPGRAAEEVMIDWLAARARR